MTNFTTARWICAALILTATQLPTFAQAIASRLYSVEVSASVQASPARVVLTWPADLNATSYSVSRMNASGNWSLLATLPGNATQYADSGVSAGARFEYQILKSTSRGYSGSGYILAGINAPPIENRGKLILLVDATWSNALAPELRRLEQDLVGDGWGVLRQDIPRNATVLQVKAAIQNLYYSDPATIRALFIFGHIPVPYSGDLMPDGHDNHRGAWPADVFYGDMDGVWTDSTVTSVLAEKTWNHNVPADGKFDQSVLPSDIELEIGRVDLFNMTCFANKSWSRDEEDLLRQYLEKDHRFRHGQLLLPRRGLIIDNFGADKEALAATGWRAFSTMFGAQNNTEIPWGTFFSTLTAGPGYLWAYGNGGGGYYTCAGIGSSDDFALNDIKTVFTFFFGSYFGDWDNESNFLRAPLGSTSYTLTSSYGSRPNWFMHGMALGETIGSATRLTQNNGSKYEPRNIGTREVHTALHGDPTLRMHSVIPPSSFTATLGSSGVTLSWSPTSDTAIAAYYLYRGTSESGPFTRIAAPAASATAYLDGAGTISSVYMIRALKLETSASGTYYNLSQGIFARPANVPAAASNLSALPQSNGIALSWTDNSNDETGFRVYRRPASGAYSLAGTVSVNVTSFLDTSAPAGGTNVYSVVAFNAVGESAWSSPVTVVPASSAAAAFVGTDTATRGSWKGVYGSQGYNVIQNAQNYPSYVSVFTSGNSTWTWTANTSDVAALLRATDNTRLAACWYGFTPFDIQLWFQDGGPHRVSLYFLDWDRSGRRQILDVLHSDTGALLATRTVENFQNGMYATFDLQGRVTLRLRPQSGNAVISGLFFDSAVAMVSTPVFTPNGGTFTNPVAVAISSATTGATIRYTTNGADPTSSSPLYTAPISLASTTTLKARAFKSGLADSAVAGATYTINTPPPAGSASAEFLGVNTTRGGEWKGEIGREGHIVMGDSQILPTYVSVLTGGKSDWIWEYSTTDNRALQRNALQSRLAACWYSSGSFESELNLSDGQVHRVSLYCLDWDRANRQQRVEILDAVTRQVLHTYTLSNFGDGVYLDYELQGRVVLRFSRITSFNAVLSGIFFDSP